MFIDLPRIILSFFCILFLQYAAHASEADHKKSENFKILFEDLEKLVNDKNENVEASRLQMKAQDRRTGRTARSFLPQLTLSAGQEQFKKDTLTEIKSDNYWRADASLNLFKGGRDYIEGEIRDQSYQLSQTDLQIELKNEIKKARQTYWKIVSINQLLLDTEEAIQKNEQNLKSAKKRVGAGLATATDSVQFELYKISLLREKTKLEHEKDDALNELSLILALDEHKNIEITSQYPVIATQSPLENQNSKFLSEKKQRNLEKIENLKSDQSSNWWLPKLDAYASYKLPAPSENLTDATNNDKEWVAGVKLTLDLGQAAEDQSESKARRLDTKALQHRAAYVARESRAIEHELSHHMQILVELIKNADQDVVLAQKFLKLTEDEYNRGVKNGPDLLEATQTHFEFRKKRTEYYRDYLSAQAERESLTD